MLLLPRVCDDDDDEYGCGPKGLRRRLRIYSIVILGTSIFFWVWAAINTIHLRRNGNDHNDNDNNDHNTTTTTTTAYGGGAGGGGAAMDLGLISFLGTELSASCLLRKSSSLSSLAAAAACHRCAPRHAPPGGYLRAFAALTQLTVTAN